jgi:hypothetical protein
MIFLDTNVFVYAGGVSHPHRDRCRSAIQRLRSRAFEATTNAEVLQEILHVWTRRGRRTEALELTREMVRLFPELLPVTADDVVTACDLMQRYPTISSRDAIHAATMLNNGITQIMSLDPDFDHIAEIRREMPS